MSKKIKILHVMPEGFGNGGVQQVVMNICRSLPKNTFEFHGLKFTNEVRFHEEEFLSFGGKVYLIDLEKFKSKKNNT